MPSGFPEQHPLSFSAAITDPQVRALLLVQVADHDLVLDIFEKRTFRAVRRFSTYGSGATLDRRVFKKEAIRVGGARSRGERQLRHIRRRCQWLLMSQLFGFGKNKVDVCREACNVTLLLR